MPSSTPMEISVAESRVGLRRAHGDGRDVAPELGLEAEAFLNGVHVEGIDDGLHALADEGRWSSGQSLTSAVSGTCLIHTTICIRSRPRLR